MYGKVSIGIEPKVLDKLREFSWHGNIRELKNTIDYMLAVCDGKVLRIRDIPDHHFFQNPTSRTISLKELLKEKEINIKDHWIILGEWECHLYLLKTIHQYNKMGKTIGRKTLAQLSKFNMEVPITEQQVRSRLQQLEKEGLIVKQKGKFGTKLTSKGYNILIDNY